ncbi:MAG: hypothetical protein ACOZIN_09800 [Myxococcota bacterium]
MGILATQEPGVLLAAVVDARSKTFAKEVQAIEAKLRALQKSLGVPGFLTAFKREGSKLQLKVLAASAVASPRPASGWTPKAQSARQVGTEIKEQLGWGKR